MNERTWDKNTEWRIGKYLHFPICKSCFEKLNTEEGLKILDMEEWSYKDPWSSDSCYRNNWNIDCWFCRVVELLDVRAATLHPFVLAFENFKKQMARTATSKQSPLVEAFLITIETLIRRKG